MYPREQTIVVKLEDYSKDRLASLNEIYKHLGLGEFDYLTLTII